MKVLVDENMVYLGRVLVRRGRVLVSVSVLLNSVCCDSRMEMSNYWVGIVVFSLLNEDVN